MRCILQAVFQSIEKKEEGRADEWLSDIDAYQEVDQEGVKVDECPDDAHTGKNTRYEEPTPISHEDVLMPACIRGVPLLILADIRDEEKDTIQKRNTIKNHQDDCEYHDLLFSLLSQMIWAVD